MVLSEIILVLDQQILWTFWKKRGNARCYVAFAYMPLKTSKTPCLQYLRSPRAKNGGRGQRPPCSKAGGAAPRLPRPCLEMIWLSVMFVHLGKSESVRSNCLSERLLLSRYCYRKAASRYWGFFFYVLSQFQWLHNCYRCCGMRMCDERVFHHFASDVTFLISAVYFSVGYLRNSYTTSRFTMKVCTTKGKVGVR